MKLKCPNPHCPHHVRPQAGFFVRNGSFFRSSDSKHVQRFQCRECRTSFSRSTFSDLRGQKKRRLNSKIKKLLSVGVSLRSCAVVLHTTQVTVARKRKFLARQLNAKREKVFKDLNIETFNEIQFDEMETFQHSKLKPLSVSVIVDKATRLILDAKVCEMPAKGLLAQKSLAKYGPRRDDRQKNLTESFKSIMHLLSKEGLKLESDLCPRYPKVLRNLFTSYEHTRYKGRRGCVVGQGELKAGGFDDLFSLNHSCAMMRANVNRLFRKTWNTTKVMECLQEHLDIYIYEHNQKIKKMLLAKKK